MVLTEKTQVITKKCTKHINSCKLGKIQRMKHPKSKNLPFYRSLLPEKRKKKIQVTILSNKAV